MRTSTSMRSILSLSGLTLSLSKGEARVAD